MIRVHEGQAIAETPMDGDILAFYAGAEGLGEIVKRGTVVRVTDKYGIVEEIFPQLPHEEWVAVDPGRIRMIFTPDTRKALVFIAGGMGMPQILESGHYRFTFTFLRDLGTPESTWSCRGSTTPETASIQVTVPGSPAPPAPGPRWQHLRVVLDDITVHEALDPWWRGAGELTIRVTITPDEGEAEPIVIDLPAGEVGWYRVQRGTVLQLRTELFDDQVSDAGVTIQIDGLELDWPDRHDVLPPLIFKSVGAKRVSSIREKPPHPGIEQPAFVKPEEREVLELRQGPWSAKIRVHSLPPRRKEIRHRE